MKIFTSYARSDKSYADTIAKTLAVHDVWYDQRLYSGSDWWEEIVRRIEGSDAFIFLLSRDSVESVYCQRELEIAIKLNRTIIPILIDDKTMVPDSLQHMQYVDMSNGIDVRNVTNLLSSLYIIERNLDTSKSIDKKTDWGLSNQTEIEQISDEQGEELAFTHFYPAGIPTMTDAPLHIYIHLASLLQQVKEDFEKRRKFSSQVMTATESEGLLFKRGTIFRIVPTIKKTRVVPPSMSVPWEDDIEHVQFTIKPDKNMNSGTGCTGHVRIFIDDSPIVVAELPIIFTLEEPSNKTKISEHTCLRFKKIFVSYSHKDEAVIKAIDRLYAKYPELETYIDYKFLKGGEHWWNEIKVKIDEAEALQLFWSHNSSASDNVEKEWRYALDLPRPVIPIMLKPECDIPDVLSPLHFEPFDQFISSL